MFVQWDRVMDVVAHMSINTGFMNKFMRAANSEKIALCMRNKFIRDCIAQWLDSVELDDSLKNAEKSKEIRSKANEAFKDNRLIECCKLYTRAAQFAPCNSVESALAFSNRSAVHMKLNQFQDCLDDIDVSLEVLKICDIHVGEVNKNQLVEKLLKRKIECLMALKRHDKAEICRKNLSEYSKSPLETPFEKQFDEKCNILPDNIKMVEDIAQPTNCTEDVIKKILEKNKIILPFVSPKMKLCSTKDKGKHFVASSKIEYGEILLFENPFSYVLLSDYYDLYCYNCCMALKQNAVPCNGCSTILFCNQKCRQESWDSYHCWECKQGTSIFKCIGIAHLALRLTLDTLKPDSKKDPIYSLLTHIDDVESMELHQYSLTAILLLTYLQKKTDFFEKNPNLDPCFVGNELLHHMTRLVCNGNSISTYIISDDENSSSAVNHSYERIGTAIYPTSSLLNHSCYPNIFSSNISKYVVVKASRSIEKGEEVTNCYGPDFRRMRKNKRQPELKAQYHFDCQCCICTDPQEEEKFYQVIEGLVCLSCHNPIQATMEDLKTRDKLCCDSCSKQFGVEKYKECLMIGEHTFDEGVEKFNKNDIFGAIEIILESLKCLSRILSQKNSIITEGEDNLGKCFALAGDFKNCYKYLEKNFPLIELRYGKNSMEVAYELDKITEIMVNNLDLKENRNLIQKALTYVRRSMEIMHANLSAWDIPFNEPNMTYIKNKENVLLHLLESSE